MIAIDGTVAEFRFVNGEKRIDYRISRASGDNSGDYTKYSDSGTVFVEGTAVFWRGDKGIRVAIWEKEGMSYSLWSAENLTEAQVRQMVKSTF